MYRTKYTVCKFPLALVAKKGCQSKRIVYNWSHIKILKCFLGFRGICVGLVREKTHSLRVVSRRDKSLGDELLHAVRFPGFFYFGCM